MDISPDIKLAHYTIVSKIGQAAFKDRNTSARLTAKPSPKRKRAIRIRIRRFWLLERRDIEIKTLTP
jgi:hypothetical protein